ncbi:uncharacterized protein IUM83_18848 [Phytophthora cinnamomi]|uniref:uncharacterized protein n=1 Tax=Phytophthora cinnamomi TaxID=4785 RepID=UPI003559D801|nr:hypothetical protein IUM83_18848 [Phytophthora cinnamomi]
MDFLRANLDAQLLAGSTDANFSLDFGANVASQAAPPCTSYLDLLDAIQGLTTFAHVEWYEVTYHPLYRLRKFVTANMDADPANTPRRVQRTLHEVNQFFGSAYIHLSSDSPAWWREFRTSTHRIKFSSAYWAIALCANITSVAPAPIPDNGPELRADSQRRVTREHGTRPAQSHPSSIPASWRALLPTSSDGQEPCLRVFGGSMCFGGMASTCAVRNRLHTWPEELPAALLTFIRRKFGHRDSNQRRRA